MYQAMWLAAATPGDTTRVKRARTIAFVYEKVGAPRQMFQTSSESSRNYRELGCGMSGKRLPAAGAPVDLGHRARPTQGLDEPKRLVDALGELLLAGFLAAEREP